MRPEGQEGGREKRDGEERGREGDGEERGRGETGEKHGRRERRGERREGGSLQMINILLFVAEHFSSKHRVRRPPGVGVGAAGGPGGGSPSQGSSASVVFPFFHPVIYGQTHWRPRARLNLGSRAAATALIPFHRFRTAMPLGPGYVLRDPTDTWVQREASCQFPDERGLGKPRVGGQLGRTRVCPGPEGPE